MGNKNRLIFKHILITESGRLEFEEFITLAAKFIIEEDAEAMEKELREAFRLYDKEGMFSELLRELSPY
jgi:Ca2+-binding EF-hand superfamily protein